MISLLQSLIATVAAFGQLVAFGVMTVVNAAISGFGSAMAAAIALLPTLPDVPANPAPDASGYIAYFFPTGTIIAFIASLLTMWGIFLALRPILRWVKGL